MSWEMCNFALYLILGMVYVLNITNSWNGVECIFKTLIYEKKNLRAVA